MDAGEQTDKLVQSLSELFDQPLFIIWLRGKQCVAPDRWVSKYTKVVDKEMQLLNKRCKVNILKLVFVPPADTMSRSGGGFTIEGDGFPKARVCCLSALSTAAPEANLVPLVPYSDDEESLVGENDDEEEVNEAMVEPGGLAPVDHEDVQQEDDASDNDAQSLDMEDEGWETGEVGESNPAKQKKFHLSEEYRLLNEEGLMKELPNIVNAGLGRHDEGAWSAHYPDPDHDGKKRYTYRRRDRSSCFLLARVVDNSIYIYNIY